jgi:hypothetical protein
MATKKHTRAARRTPARKHEPAHDGITLREKLRELELRLVDAHAAIEVTARALTDAGEQTDLEAQSAVVLRGAAERLFQIYEELGKIEFHAPEDDRLYVRGVWTGNGSRFVTATAA